MMITRLPWLARATAKFPARVDFPTPPFCCPHSIFSNVSTSTRLSDFTMESVNIQLTHMSEFTTLSKLTNASNMIDLSKITK